MKRLPLIALLVSVIALGSVSCGRVETMVNKAEGYLGLLNRTVTLYDANGKAIKSWNTSNEITYQGPAVQFVDKDGLNVRIGGTFIIEGK